MSTSIFRAPARIICSVAVLVALVAAGCGGSDKSSSSTSSSKPAAGDNKIRVALVQAATADLPFQFALNRGLFKKAGLDVTLKTPSIPFSQLPATLGKQFDIVIGSQPDLIHAKSTGIDVVAISGLQKNNPKDPGAALVVPGNSPIHSIKDLKGKTVGAPSIVGNNWSSLQCWAKKNGLKPTDFRGLEAPVPQLPDLLKKGRFDSILIFEPLLTPAVASGDRNIGDAYDGCFGRAEYTAILLSQGAWAKSHSAQIGKFLQAMNDGKAEVAKDPAAAKKLYIKTSGLPPAAAARTPIIADEFDFSQGQVLVDDMKIWLKLLNDLGTFKGSLDPASVVAPAAGS